LAFCDDVQRLLIAGADMGRNAVDLLTISRGWKKSTTGPLKDVDDRIAAANDQPA
jgi:hypothetical protein